MTSVYIIYTENEDVDGWQAQEIEAVGADYPEEAVRKWEANSLTRQPGDKVVRVDELRFLEYDVVHYLGRITDDAAIWTHNYPPKEKNAKETRDEERTDA